MKKITILLLIILSLALQAQIRPIIYYTKTITASRQYVKTRPVNTAVLEIKFNSNSLGFIEKPLIVVEDFDSGFMGKENSYGELDLNDFLTQSTSAVTLTIKKKSNIIRVPNFLSN